MAERNNEISLTGDPRVDAALGRIRGKFQDLEDATLVQVTLERKMGERIKEHAEFLVDHDEVLAKHNEVMARHNEVMARHNEVMADHDEAIAKHKESIAEHDRIWKRIDIAMAEMTEKVHFLLNREMKREGGPEAA